VDAERGSRLGSFLIGGLVGSVAGLAAAGRVRVKAARRERTTAAGLAAFEQAPCFRELVNAEGSEAEGEEAVAGRDQPR
jgi:gas vesicle protein